MVLPMAMRDNCDDLEENVLQTAMIQEIEIQDSCLSIAHKRMTHSIQIRKINEMKVEGTGKMSCRSHMSYMH